MAVAGGISFFGLAILLRLPTNANSLRIVLVEVEQESEVAIGMWETNWV
jgi:hypothetical protein